MSDVYTAKELKERLAQNDNRATAKPYLLFLQEKRKYVAHDEFDNGGVEDVWIESLTGDYHTTPTRKEMIDYFNESEIPLSDKNLEYIHRSEWDIIGIVLMFS